MTTTLRLLGAMALFLLFLSSMLALAQDDQASVSHVDSADVEWEAVLPREFPEGMYARPLHVTEAGGGVSRIRVEAGFAEPEHYHTSHAHSIYVLAGRVSFAGKTATAGHFFHTPINVPHALIAEEDSELLIWADGALDFVLVPTSEE